MEKSRRKKQYGFHCGKNGIDFAIINDFVERAKSESKHHFPVARANMEWDLVSINIKKHKQNIK